MSEEVKTEAPQADEELKVVVNIKGTGAMLGVQKTGCDPVFETILDATFEQALEAVPALVELARLRWSTNPRNPDYDRPVPVAPPAATQPAPRPATPKRSRGGEKVEEYKLL